MERSSHPPTETSCEFICDTYADEVLRVYIYRRVLSDWPAIRKLTSAGWRGSLSVGEADVIVT